VAVESVLMMTAVHPPHLLLVSSCYGRLISSTVDSLIIGLIAMFQSVLQTISPQQTAMPKGAKGTAACNSPHSSCLVVVLGALSRRPAAPVQPLRSHKRGGSKPFRVLGDGPYPSFMPNVPARMFWARCQWCYAISQPTPKRKKKNRWECACREMPSA
jgi:hypothetical protein